GEAEAGGRVPQSRSGSTVREEVRCAPSGLSWLRPAGDGGPGFRSGGRFESERYPMNSYLGKTVRLGTPLLAILILYAAVTTQGCAQRPPADRGRPAPANRATALAQGPAEVKSGKSSAEQGAPLLVLESLGVDPATPGPNTLCELRARIRN